MVLSCFGGGHEALGGSNCFFGIEEFPSKPPSIVGLVVEGVSSPFKGESFVGLSAFVGESPTIGVFGGESK